MVQPLLLRVFRTYSNQQTNELVCTVLAYNKSHCSTGLLRSNEDPVYNAAHNRLGDLRHLHVISYRLVFVSTNTNS